LTLIHAQTSFRTGKCTRVLIGILVLGSNWLKFTGDGNQLTSR